MSNWMKDLGLEKSEKEIIGELIDCSLYRDYYNSKEEQAQIEEREDLYNVGYALFDLYG